ncbi:MAG: DUF2946 family protein [Methylocella sp.]
MGRVHSPRRRDAASASGGLARAWLHMAAHGAAFAALLVVVLAPLHLCCVNHHAASHAASLHPALGPGAQIAHCAHGGEDGGDRHNQAPASPGENHCPACHLVNGVVLIPPLAADAAYAQSAIEILAPPETLGFRAATAILAARPRGPPVLI